MNKGFNLKRLAMQRFSPFEEVIITNMTPKGIKFENNKVNQEFNNSIKNISPVSYDELTTSIELMTREIDRLEIWKNFLGEDKTGRDSQ